MGFDFQSAYDELNPDDADYRFYVALAQQLGARRVLDLGCGTGVLARLLAQAGHTVTAIDPDADMLRVARGRPGAELVDWRVGYSDSADPGSADLAVMSGHVAQVFVEVGAWRATLGDLHRALGPGGTLAFETRNPTARGWEAWTREATLRTVESEGDRAEFWHETVAVDLPVVTYDTFTRNLETGDEERHRNLVAFLDIDALVASLEEAGFEVDSLFGTWARTPVTAEAPEIVVVARRR